MSAKETTSPPIILAKLCSAGPGAGRRDCRQAEEGTCNQAELDVNYRHSFNNTMFNSMKQEPMQNGFKQ